MFIASDLGSSLLVLGIAAAVYLFPTVVAFHRGVPSPWSVAVINVLLGWTLIGWAVAMAMAARDAKPSRASGA